MKQKFFRVNSFPNNPDVRTSQYFRIMHPNIGERIEETFLLARQHGIEYRYPFLDVKLIEFFFSLPSKYKHKNGYGRYLYRSALKGVIPEQIRLRMDKVGTTIPNVLPRVLKDEDLFIELIKDGQGENKYHYVDYDKLLWYLKII